MPYVNETLSIVKGRSYTRLFLFFDELGNPYDLENSGLVMQMRRTASNDEVLFEASTYNGLLTYDPLKPGEVVLGLLPAHTDRFRFSEAVYEIIQVGPDTTPDQAGDTPVLTLAMGGIRVVKSVVREWQG